LDGGWRAPEQTRPKLRKIEGQDAAQIDVLVPDRREATQHLVRIAGRYRSMAIWSRCVFQAMTMLASKVRAPEIAPSSSIVRPCFAVIMPL
jgi:hypothetical protein